MAYGSVINLGLGTSQTGLAASLRATFADSLGMPHATLRDIATGFSEIGNGVYLWYYASFPDDFKGNIVFHVGDIGGASNFTGVTLKAHSQVNRPTPSTMWTDEPRTLTG